MTKQTEACPFCGTALKKRQGNYEYKESGLPNVLLQNITIGECSGCTDGGGPEIPNILGLHECLAAFLVLKKERLVSYEIRFLRKSLGWSSKDFAKKMNVKPETVSRWESDDSPHAMGLPNERLLRLYVATEKPIENYRVHDTEDLAETTPPKKGKVAPLTMRHQGDAWCSPTSVRKAARLQDQDMAAAM